MRITRSLCGMVLSVTMAGSMACAREPVFPLKVSANRRYLVNRNDRPFLAHGDTAWSLVSGLSKAETKAGTRRPWPTGRRSAVNTGASWAADTETLPTSCG